LPIFAHLLIAVLLIFAWGRVNIQRVISILGHFLVLLVSIQLYRKTWFAGILTMQAGASKAPFGITFVSDTLIATLLLLTPTAGLGVGIFSLFCICRSRMQFWYFPVYHFLLMGFNGSFLAGHIFNLNVWFEIVIISPFVLKTLAGKKPQMQGAI